MSIVVHGRDGCAPCQTLKYWLNKKGITYKYVEGGADIYPTIKIDSEVIRGLQWVRLNQLLSVS